MLTRAPRGTKDILPAEAARWHFLEEEIRELCRCYGFGEIRTPIFEHTELFERGVGETTDIVQKEMYTFRDRSNRSITLRPEGTASVVRAFIEHGLYSEPQPVKLFYLSLPIFRYEKPQAGRYRQHHQFGAEIFGSPEPAADAEVITLAWDLFSRLGVKDLRLLLNSIGCPACRPAYREALKDYFRQYLEGLCPDCTSRFERNPLRLLDCKQDGCHRVAEGAPPVLASNCPECSRHLSALLEILGKIGVPHEINHRIVRGLDYYTRTVFEFVHGGLGAQDTVCAGGRYDGLVEECGGKPTPGVGFGMGMERLLLLLEEEGFEFPPPPKPEAFVATAGPETRLEGRALVHQLRREGITAESDYLGRSLKSQMKHADRLGVRFVVILGQDELAGGFASVRDMIGGNQQLVRLDAVSAFLLEQRSVAEEEWL